MAEYRKDPLLERWVIIAEERGARPQEFVDRAIVRRSGACPFCAGSEAATPGEILALRAPETNPNEPGWRVRVIPNRYPAVNTGPGVNEAPVAAAPLAAWPCVSQPIVGVHEVIIEAAEHIAGAGRLTEKQTAEVLSVYRARLLALRADPALRYVQIFKNVGEAAGASIEHLHSQLLGLPTVPALVAEEVQAAARLFEERGRCVFCELRERETLAGERIVEESTDYTLFCPYASRFPYEMCLLPKRHSADFASADDGDLAAAAVLLRRGFARLEQLLDDASYNCVLHTAPFDRLDVPHYHWHMEILPRLVKAAGFEWATDVHINPISPEAAARALRAVAPPRA